MDTFILSSLINFAVVVLILWYYGRKPAADFFVQRNRSIEQSIVEAETASFEAQKQLTHWESQWRGCESHAKVQREETERNLRSFREKALVGARAEAERLKQDAKLVGQSEVMRAKNSLRKELAAQSIEGAGRLLNRELDEKDRHKLIAEYVEKLANGTAG